MFIVVYDDNRRDLITAVEILSGIFGKYGFNYDLAIFQSSIELLEKIKKVDIAILDISKECFNGIELGR